MGRLATVTFGILATGASLSPLFLDFSPEVEKTPVGIESLDGGEPANIRGNIRHYIEDAGKAQEPKAPSEQRPADISIPDPNIPADPDFEKKIINPQETTPPAKPAVEPKKEETKPKRRYYQEGLTMMA